jgi:hypothetical protein
LINTRQSYRAPHYRRLLTMTVQILEGPDDLRPG